MLEARIEISKSADGPGHRLEATQWLPRPRAQVFAFFSDALQLQAITPPHLHFSVLTPSPISLREGTLIDYELRLYGLPLRWQSRIECWEPPRRFIDVQTRGPYRRWRHQHVLEEYAGGTRCHDIVDYAVPGGGLIHWLVVRRDLLKIFSYRQRKLRELCDATTGPLAQGAPVPAAHAQNCGVP